MAFLVAVFCYCYLGMKSWSLEMSECGCERNVVETFPRLEIRFICFEERVGRNERIIVGW